jgi:hypothetical protein
MNLAVGLGAFSNSASTETGKPSGGVETEQLLLPLQAPDHPANLEPLAGSAVSSTDVPMPKDPSQSNPQTIPAGVERTTPCPVPDLVTETEY